MAPSPTEIVTMVTLGSSKIGKTCFVSRFLEHAFNECYFETIEDQYRKHMQGVIVDLVDMGGNAELAVMRSRALKDKDGM